MQIIPVIDLKGGEVVRAFKGKRSSYRPIVTPLASSSAPERVVEGFLRLHPFSTVYIADLDAIEGRGDHAETILSLAAAFPGVTFWVDAGVSDAARLQRWLAAPRIDPVVGSESLTSDEFAENLTTDSRIVLSLDFRGETFLGPRDLLYSPQRWPQRVIAMTLARVGASGGPDIDLLTSLMRRAGGRVIYAAGGVRDAADLERLQRIGAGGALIASALHDGRLTGGDLRRLS
jgi:HisA/HisF family protein